MVERGFTNVDYLESGDTQYSIYYNPDSRQCIQLTVANNKTVSADDSTPIRSAAELSR